MSKRKIPQFGDDVCWYRQADTRQQPALAKVVGVMDDNYEGPTLSLIVLQGDRPNLSITGVRHSSSPVLKERPRGMSIAKDSGCFETLAEFLDRQAAEELRIETQRAQDKLDHQEEMKARAALAAKREAQPV